MARPLFDWQALNRPACGSLQWVPTSQPASCAQASATSAPDSELSFAGDLRTSSGSPEPSALAVAPAAVSAVMPGGSSGNGARATAGPPPAASGCAALQHLSITMQLHMRSARVVTWMQCKLTPAFWVHRLAGPLLGGYIDYRGAAGVLTAFSHLL